MDERNEAITFERNARAATLRALGKLLTEMRTHDGRTYSMLNMIYHLVEDVHRRHDQHANVDVLLYAAVADLLLEMFDIELATEK